MNELIHEQKRKTHGQRRGCESRHPEPHTCINMMVMSGYACTQKHRGTNQLRHLEAQFPTDVCHVQPGLQGLPRQAHTETHRALTSPLTYLAVPDVAGDSFIPAHPGPPTAPLPQGAPSPWPHLALQVGGLRPACVVCVDDLHDV